MVRMRLDRTSSSSGGIATQTVAASIVHSVIPSVSPSASEVCPVKVTGRLQPDKLPAKCNLHMTNTDCYSHGAHRCASRRLGTWASTL